MRIFTPALFMALSIYTVSIECHPMKRVGGILNGFNKVLYGSMATGAAVGAGYTGAAAYDGKVKHSIQGHEFESSISEGMAVGAVKGATSIPFMGLVYAAVLASEVRQAFGENAKKKGVDTYHADCSKRKIENKETF